MSATIHEETMTVSRSKIVDLIAALHAAASLIAVRDKRFDREDRANAINAVADTFRLELLGPSPDDDEAYATDSTLVELDARSVEIEAELIASCLHAQVSWAETRAKLEARDGREAQLREHAKRIRASGNIDISFPTAEEMQELARREERSDDAN